MLPACQKTMPSVFNRNDNIISSGYSAQNVFLPNGNSSGRTFGPVAVSSGYDPWLQNGLFPPLPGSLKTHESGQNERIYGSPSGSAISNVLECSPANCWSKNEWHAHGSEESIGKSSAAKDLYQQQQQHELNFKQVQGKLCMN